MKGLNYLRINHETMCQAIQGYLDGIFTPTDGLTREVKKVEYLDVKQMQYTNAVGSTSGDFIITIDSKTPEQK